MYECPAFQKSGAVSNPIQTRSETSVEVKLSAAGVSAAGLEAQPMQDSLWRLAKTRRDDRRAAS
jgi:hypothetical protein